MKLTGIFPPIPTPFERGHFSPPRLAENLARWHETGLSGYLVLGSNGEAPLLSDAEKTEVVRIARQAIPEDETVIVGTGLESTDATRVLTSRVADVGADVALVLPPSFYQSHISDDALRRHFEAIAESSPIPILLYNVPKFTHFNMPANLVAALAEHPKIIGMPKEEYAANEIELD